MTFSDLPSPDEASNPHDKRCQGFAQAGNRFPSRIESGAGFFGIMLYGNGAAASLSSRKRREEPAMDDKTRTELEAAAFRRLLEHLRTRTDVQNIDMMNLAGFCRNCLSNWMKDAADAQGVPMSKEASREAIYGMPFEQWKAKYQKEASAEQQAAFAKSNPKH
jgi:hypothetical protein